MGVFAGITAASTIFFLAVARPSGLRYAVDAPSAGSGFAPLLRDRQILLLLVLSFLGLGVFNGLTTWLEPIVAPRGIYAVPAGLAGGAILLGGVVGAVVLPALSDRLGRRKPFLVLCVAGALGTIYP